MLPPDSIADLAQSAHVRVLVAGEQVWHQGDPPGEDLDVLVRGRIEYHITSDEQTEMVAVRDEGDLLGLTPLLRSQPARTTAKVVAGELPRESPVEQIMASPVITVSALSSATAAILLMLRERIGQVCVTQDGTTATPALDVFTHKDLLAQSGHHPAGLLREFRHARTVARLRELCDEVEEITGSYLDASVSAIFLGQICAELYDELIQRLLELTTTEMNAAGAPLPSVSWAWLSVGSDGRREQTLRTDMDLSLIHI